MKALPEMFIDISWCFSIQEPPVCNEEYFYTAGNYGWTALEQTFRRVFLITNTSVFTEQVFKNWKAIETAKTV